LTQGAPHLQRVKQERLHVVVVVDVVVRVVVEDGGKIKAECKKTRNGMDGGKKRGKVRSLVWPLLRDARVDID
jgi:hypothetical protein